jgi:hypothetical protein
MDLLNWLTTKIYELENNWKIKNDILYDALNIINLSSNIEKNNIIIKNVNFIIWTNIEELTISDLIMVWLLFNDLKLEY